MLYFALRAFGFLVTNINIKMTIYCSPSLLSFSILSLLFLILSSISLPSSLHISPHSLLSLSLSLSSSLSLISPHVFDLLTVLASPPAPFLSLLLPSHLFFVPLPFYSPSPCTFSRRVVFLFFPSSRKFSSVSPVSHPI
jgi:hypothetical protein